MKAVVKEEASNKLRYIYTNVDRSDYDFTKIRLMLHDDLGWVVKYNFFSGDMLTSVELREIAQKLDEYNNLGNTKKWKQKTSKNL